MQVLKQLWLRITRSPVIVATYTTFLGALGTQIQSAWTTGHLTWSLAGWEHMAGAAGLLTAYTLAHLYAPAPGANPKPLPTTTVQ
jgi:hypothetical protein